jgi:type II secretory pathway component GspD/PulD (secretin)
VLTSILSRNGKVSVEPRTNSLIVTDIPEVFPQVEQIIAELDKKAPQVMIEAQIVEIDSNRTKDLGLEWGGANGELGSFQAGARDTKFPLVLPGDLGKTRFMDPLGAGSIISTLGTSSSGNTNGASAATSSGGSTSLVTGQSFVKTSVLDLTALTITLRALVSRSEARFLGKPKILTLNNKTAIIQIASNQGVSVQQTQSSVGGGLGQASQTVERVQTGLILRVTPQVNKDGYITMLVQPSFTNVQASDISTASNKIFDPVSRGASTLVRVKNGQTLVLGGLLESNETKVVRKVPFLGYIPLIGWLFTSLSNTRNNLDLVIFITPTIVND